MRGGSGESRGTVPASGNRSVSRGAPGSAEATRRRPTSSQSTCHRGQGQAQPLGNSVQNRASRRSKCSGFLVQNHPRLTHCFPLQGRQRVRRRRRQRHPEWLPLQRRQQRRRERIPFGCQHVRETNQYVLVHMQQGDPLGVVGGVCIPPRRLRPCQRPRDGVSHGLQEVKQWRLVSGGGGLRRSVPDDRLAREFAASNRGQ